MKPILPKGFRFWPTDLVGNLTPTELSKAYSSGLSGIRPSEDEAESLYATQRSADSVVSQFGIENLGKNKLTILFAYAQQVWNVWPKPPQQTGDCVGKAAANIGIILITMDVLSGLPDEKTGLLEGIPELTPLAIRQGVVADEPAYGDRGHSGQGASCERLIRHVTQDGGIVLRKNYTELGINLESYNVKLGMNWGRSHTPDKLREIGRQHQIRESVRMSHHEMCRDFMAAGKPLWACSGLGWSNKRDEFGYSAQEGSWPHSWISGAYDDRPETKAKYGFPMFLFIHDWGKWNSGGRKIYKTDPSILIPEGSFWADARLLDKCNVHALASIQGWAPTVLPAFNPKVPWF